MIIFVKSISFGLSKEPTGQISLEEKCCSELYAPCLCGPGNLMKATTRSVFSVNDQGEEDYWNM